MGRTKPPKAGPSRRQGDRPHPRSEAKAEPSAPGPERLQKVLAAAGVASRRQCEQLILEGRVEVDQQVVTTLGTKVDTACQSICVDGVRLAKSRLVYYLIHKPKGVVSTHRDPAGRPRVVDMVPEEGARLFSVGRLDRESEGLMLLTNDGELAHRLAHPRFGVEKTYQVQVAGIPDHAVLGRLRSGVRLAEVEVAVARVRIKRLHKQSAILEIVLREGKNREIRRMLAGVGHKVQRLKRVALGPLKLGKLPLGGTRLLTKSEIASLRRAADSGEQDPRLQGEQRRRSRRKSTSRRRS